MNQKDISSLFKQYFEVVRADTDELKQQCHKVRFDVYCDELGFEDPSVFPDGVEKDDVDRYSHHYLIKHLSSGRYAGTVRVVDPAMADPAITCPFEKHCLSSIDQSDLHPLKFYQGTYCEVSRLAVPKYFRRREGEENQPFIYESDRMSVSMEEQKTFPYIAVGLYLSAAAHFVCAKHLHHIYVMMEPRLAVHLRRVGIGFKQIGPVVDYHGMRAAYHVNEERLLNCMRPHMRDLYNAIEVSVKQQMRPSMSQAYH